MVRYAITTGDGVDAAAVNRWVAAGVSFAQLRDKSIDAGELAARARGLLGQLREANIRLLINGRVDVALAVGAAGVHLTADPNEWMPQQVRLLMPGAVISVSCHTVAEVARARDQGADWILFGPVFEKRVGYDVVAEGVGLKALSRASAAAPGRVLALGGVTRENSEACVQAEAAGVAGIRLFG